MKKLISTIFVSLFFLTSSHALEGVNMGLSLTGGVFEVDGGSEDFAAGHVSNTSGSAAVSKKASAEGDSAEGAFAIGSIFVEKEFGDRFAVGIDYVPHSMESETTENVQIDTPTEANGTSQTNSVQVDFNDLTTIYVTASVNENLYVKLGMMTVDVKTNETLATGGSYGDTSLDGMVFGVGYNADLSNGSFIRLEANIMDFDGTTVTNANDTDKSVSVDGIDGYGARISVGKSF